LSFTISNDGKQFELLPLYDMLPMALMPRNDFIPDSINCTKPSLCTEKIFHSAQVFWQSILEHQLISDDMKSVVLKCVDWMEGCC